MSMHKIWRERMSQWVVPNWDQSHQIRQRPSQAAAAAEAEAEEESNRSSHVHFPQKSLMSKYEAMAQPWRNQELLPTPSVEHSWDVETGDTLESIVRQATTTSDKQSVDLIQPGQKLAHMSSTEAPSDGKCIQSSRQEQMAMAAMAPLSRKPTWSNPEILERNTTNSMHAESENGDFSTCGGASATFCSDMDTTLITWPSPESPRSLKTNNTVEDLTPPWASEEEHNIKRITDGCRSTKRTRSATTHNQSERRRRDRINQKFKDLQKLVPYGNKTDTASLLDDTIKYLKQLQVQVQLMSSIRTMPQMIMALEMQQQQLQMSLLARMGMGVGLLESDAMARSTMQSIARLLHPTSAATTSHAFAPHQVLTPSMMPTTQAKAKLSTSAPVPPADPFCTFLAQPSMNMDLYSKMVTLYCQEVNRTPSQTGKSSESRHVRGNEIASKKKLQRFG